MLAVRSAPPKLVSYTQDSCRRCCAAEGLPGRARFGLVHRSKACKRMSPTTRPSARGERPWVSVKPRQAYGPKADDTQRPWVVSQVTPGGSDRTQPADVDGAERPHSSIRRVSLTDKRG
jgi:hypothetical protein